VLNNSYYSYFFVEKNPTFSYFSVKKAPSFFLLFGEWLLEGLLVGLTNNSAQMSSVMSRCAVRIFDKGQLKVKVIGQG